MKIPLSGGAYNGGVLETGPLAPSTGDYLAVVRHPQLHEHFYLLHSNGVARHDPHFSKGQPFFVYGYEEVKY